MDKITITVEVNDDKTSLNWECDLDLYPGKPMSLAEVAVAEIMRRTHGAWNLKSNATRLTESAKA